MCELCLCLSKCSALCSSLTSMKWSRIKWSIKLFLRLCPTFCLKNWCLMQLEFTQYTVLSHLPKVNLSLKCNLGFFSECIWDKCSCKSIIMTKEILLRFSVFSFSAETHFQWECMGHFYASVKIAIFKTLRRLNTTWNFARSIRAESGS